MGHSPLTSLSTGSRVSGSDSGSRRWASWAGAAGCGRAPAPALPPPSLENDPGERPGGRDAGGAGEGEGAGRPDLASCLAAAKSCARSAARQHRPATGKEDAKLAQKLGQLQCFIALFSHAGMHGPTCIVWANLTAFSLMVPAARGGVPHRAPSRDCAARRPAARAPRRGTARGRRAAGLRRGHAIFNAVFMPPLFVLYGES
jgi:hypothetical protein